MVKPVPKPRISCFQISDLADWMDDGTVQEDTGGEPVREDDGDICFGHVDLCSL